MSKEFVFTHWTALDSEPEDSTYPQSNTCSGRSHPAPISNIQSYHTYVTYAHEGDLPVAQSRYNTATKLKFSFSHHLWVH